MEDYICKTNAKQLGDKWEHHLERGLENNRATNGRHLESMGKTILGDKRELLGNHPSKTGERQLDRLGDK